MAALDKIPNLYGSAWFESRRKDLQASVDRDGAAFVEGLLSKVRENGDEAVVTLSAPEAGLVDGWWGEFGGREGAGYLVFIVVVVSLIGLFSSTPLPLTVLIVVSVFMALSIAGWIVGSARAVDALEKVVRSNPAWKRTVYVVGRKGIYDSARSECCPFVRVVAVELGEDDAGPFVAYREDSGRNPYQQKIRGWKRGAIDEARQVASHIEREARAANATYYEEGRRDQKSGGTRASI